MPPTTSEDTNPSVELLHTMGSLPAQIQTLRQRDDGRTLVESLTDQLRELIETAFAELGVDHKMIASITPSHFQQAWSEQLGDPATAELADRFTTFCADPHQYMGHETDPNPIMARTATKLRRILAEHRVIGRAIASAQAYSTVGGAAGQRTR